MRLVSILIAVLLVPIAAFAQTVTLGSAGRQITIAIGDDAVLPADFPEDVFVPADAELQRVQHVDDAALLLQFGTAAEPAAVSDQYAAAMAVAGWTPARVAPVPGAIVQAWEKDRRAVLIVATAAEGTTLLQLQLRSRRGSGATPPR